MSSADLVFTAAALVAVAAGLTACEPGTPAPAAVSAQASPPTSARAAAGPATVRFTGTCDASAAAEHVAGSVLVADDENNRLRVYPLTGGAPTAGVDLSAHLGIGPADEHPEADIEGAARVGERVYWITSHGRSKKGKLRPNRHRFFATEAGGDGDAPPRPVGRPYRRLAEDLVAYDRRNRLGLADAIQLDDASKKRLAPKDEGLNIEALAAAPGGGLWIGLRNPRPGGKALIIPLRNPAALLADAGEERADFGPPILLDLGGLGLRSLDPDPGGPGYLLVAGPHHSGGRSVVLRWTGDAAVKPRLHPELQLPPGFNPEALTATANGKGTGGGTGPAGVLVLSDDGTVPVRVSAPSESTEPPVDGFCPCKSLVDPSRKSFRGLVLPR